MKKLLLSVMALASVMSASALDSYTNGVFVLNEDWYGHNSSTINFYSYETKSMHYRVFQEANPDMTLGNTTQYAVMYGNNMYFMSKQDYNGSEATAAGRFIVADAKTLKVKYSYNTLPGDGDGRSYCPVTETAGLIGTSKGVAIWNEAATDKLTGVIAGTEPYEVGNMVFVPTRGVVIAAFHSSNSGSGYGVIDLNTMSLKQIVSMPSITTVFQLNNGDVYAVSNDCTWGEPTSSNTEQFVPINLGDFSAGTPVAVAMAPQNTWFAWKNSDPALDMKRNIGYYSPAENSNYICKYDFNMRNFTQKFITFDGNEQMYGNVTGYDNDKDYVIATTYESYASQNYYFHIWAPYNSAENVSLKLDAGYWFPAQIIVAQTATVTGVDAVDAAAQQVASVKYYNLQGVESNEPFNGVNIVVKTMANGSRQTTKQLIKR